MIITKVIHFSTQIIITIIIKIIYNNNMTCFHPLSGFLIPSLEKNKNKVLVRQAGTFSVHYAGKRYSEESWFPLPCGKCIGCKMDYAKNWSVRLQLEASLYDDSLNHFVTLTYDDAHNPVTLVKRDVQLFMKRLRSKFPNRRISYFLAGEYGTSSGRPHYHILLFNVPLVLKPHLLTIQDGLYRCDLLESIWTFGNVVIGDVSEKSIKYTARYCVKKIGVDVESRELMLKNGLLPEFVLMSRRPGIGSEAFDLNWFNDGYIPLNGHKYPIGRYFRELFIDHGYSYDVLQARSQYLIDLHYKKIPNADVYYEELKNKEIELKSRINILMKRNLDQYGID